MWRKFLIWESSSKTLQIVMLASTNGLQINLMKNELANSFLEGINLEATFSKRSTFQF